MSPEGLREAASLARLTLRAPSALARLGVLAFPLLQIWCSGSVQTQPRVTYFQGLPVLPEVPDFASPERATSTVDPERGDMLHAEGVRAVLLYKERL